MKWKDKLDPTLTKISIYVIGTVSAIYLLYQVSYRVQTLLNFLFVLLGSLFKLLLPLFWGFFLAYLLMPVTDFLQKKIANTKWSNKEKTYRSIAVGLTIVLVILFVIIFLSVLITTFTSQVQIADVNSTMSFIRGVMENLQIFYNSLIRELDTMPIDSVPIQEGIDAVIKASTDYLNSFGRNMFSGLEDLPNILSKTLITVIFAMWFLLDGAKISMYWGKVLYAIFPDDVREKIRDFLDDVDEVFSGYIRGQMLDAVIMMAAISITLSFCKVPFAVPIGILAGLGNLIPYIGPFIAYAGVIVVCGLNAQFSKMIFSLIVLWVIQSIDGNIVNPKLLGKHVNIHPMYVIISLIIGSAWGGLLGMLFAVPVVALIKLQFDRRIKRRITKKQEREHAQQNNS